jgi:hypothetical protein
MSNSIQRFNLNVLNAKDIQVTHHMSFGFSDVGHWKIYQKYIIFVMVIVFLYIIKNGAFAVMRGFTNRRLNSGTT